MFNNLQGLRARVSAVACFFGVLLFPNSSIGFPTIEELQMIDSGDATSEPVAEAYFGGSLTLKDGHLIVGAPMHVYTPEGQKFLFPFGSAFTFDHQEGCWVKDPSNCWHIDEELYEDGGPVEDFGDYSNYAMWRYGLSTDVHSNYLIVGAPWRGYILEEVLYERMGVVHVYQKVNSHWQQVGAVRAISKDSNLRYGRGVAVTDNELLVGAPHSDEASDIRGRVHIYDLEEYVNDPDPYMDPGQILFAPTESGEVMTDGFGECIAIDEHTHTLMAIGAPIDELPKDADNGFEFDDGAVHIYRFVNDQWVFDASLFPFTDDGVRGEFGKSVACSIDEYGVQRVVVGEPSHCQESDGIGYCDEPEKGKVHIYRYDFVDEEWIKEAVLYSPITSEDADDYFGYSVAIQGYDVIIGSPRIGEGLLGAAFRVSYSSCSGWEFKEQLVASDANQSKLFGQSVAIENEWVVIGASQTDLHTDVQYDHHGAAYTFRVTPTEVQECQGDINEDGVINEADLLLVVSILNDPSQYSLHADFDCNNVVDAQDLSDLILNWGYCSNYQSLEVNANACTTSFLEGEIDVYTFIECVGE